MPQFEVATFSSQIFWLCTLFAILFLCARYLFLPRLKFIRRSRKDKTEMILGYAEELQLEAEALEKKNNSRIENFELEMRDYMESNIQILKNKISLEEKFLHRKLQDKMADIDLSLQSHEAQLIESTKENVFALSAQLLEKMTGQSIAKKDIETMESDRKSADAP